jgi:Fe2+ transport system protein FeoA
MLVVVQIMRSARPLWAEGRARETQLNATSEEERPRGVVVKLAAIVILQCTDRATELGGDPGKEVRVVKVSGFNRRGKVQRKWEKSSKITK